jgi:predicted XRE-type DNA-binding protein
MAIKIERSTGNVFRDLGFDAEEAENLRLRASLMVEIRRLIETRKLTQSAAAKLLGVTQPRISDLARGKIDLFSIDTLVNMLSRAGMRVDIRLSSGRHSRKAQAAWNIGFVDAVSGRAMSGRREEQAHRWDLAGDRIHHQAETLQGQRSEEWGYIRRTEHHLRGAATII